MKRTLLSAKVSNMGFDEYRIYTSSAKTISVWEKTTMELVDVITVPPNDNLTKGVHLCVDDRNIYFTSLYFFHAMDKKTFKVIYQKQFGTDNSSDFDLGAMITDQDRIYFPIRNGGLVIIDKKNYENPRCLNEHGGSIWALTQQGSKIYTGGIDQRILGVDKSTLSVSTVFSGHKGNIHAVYTYKHLLVSTAADDSLMVWNNVDGSVLHQIRKAGCSLGRAVINDRYLVSFAKGYVKIWDAKTWDFLKVARVQGFMHVDPYADTLNFAKRETPGGIVVNLNDILGM